MCRHDWQKNAASMPRKNAAVWLKNIVRLCRNDKWFVESLTVFRRVGFLGLHKGWLHKGNRNEWHCREICLESAQRDDSR